MMRLSASVNPVITSDVVSTVVHYTDGVTDVQLPLMAAHTANTRFDISGDATAIASGPGYTSEASRPPRAANWLGSINVGPMAGQIECDVSFKQRPRWDVWNAPRDAQREICLKAGGAPKYQFIVPKGTAGIIERPWGPIDVNNSLTFFAGDLVTANFELNHTLNCGAPPGGICWAYVGVGYGSTSTFSGFPGAWGFDLGIICPGNGIASGVSVCGKHSVIDQGSVVVTALAWSHAEASPDYPATATFFGANEGNMVMTGKWLG